MTTSATVWPARRVGDRILCGRRDAHGRYVCQGELALVRRYDEGGFEYTDAHLRQGIPVFESRAFVGFGMTEDPVGSHHWRRTRAHRGAAVQIEGLTKQMLRAVFAFEATAGGTVVSTTGRDFPQVMPSLPCWVRCPCGVDAKLTDVLMV